jgi:glutaredoxin
MSDVKLTPDPAAQGADPKITIYSTNWCAFCKTEKQYLDRTGIPVTDIAGELVLGFDRLKIDQLIQEKGIQPVAA